jgi:Zn finger protein HypA/HybF involved in hydrogenase expression
MAAPQGEFRCEGCEKISPVSTLVRDRWGDPCCPDCRSPRLVHHRSKLSAIVSVYFFFNVV